MARLLLAAAVAAALLGCGSLEPAGDDANVERAAAPIVRGARDHTHDAVVAIVGPEHLCSATIVATRPPALYLLTAAHCVAPVAPSDPELALFGPDYALATTSFPIEHCTPDPRYDGESYDFAMCRARGATEATPVLPVQSSPDELAVGTPVRHVGYGVTGSAEANSERFQVVSELTEVDPLLLWYDQQPGGPCSGDSGGPQLSVDDPGRVVGVTSFGDMDCDSFGASGRISVAASSFILPFVEQDEAGGAGGSGGRDDGQELAGGAGGGAPGSSSPPKGDLPDTTSEASIHASYPYDGGCSLGVARSARLAAAPLALVASWLLARRRRRAR